jgi:hypothetical protein
MSIQAKKIRKSIDYRKSREYVIAAQKIITDEFNHLKSDLIKAFDEHPVTREIEAGPGGSNISGTLGGRGNLFGFIGFDSGSRPTEVIRRILKDQTFINAVVVRRDGSINSVIQYPKAADIFSETPLPWAEGRSWAEGIERGLSGLGFYLKVQSDKSRSNAGIQSEHQLREAKFSNTQYISAIIKDFERKISFLNKRTIT